MSDFSSGDCRTRNLTYECRITHPKGWVTKGNNIFV
ncbi:hypothetical protein TRIP_C90208 [Candidatus Zixiibacteriota bacterium]|nr:hypothetical protein TRIP_C90208 [candidate division Zixibacteria bacterium]